MSIAVTEEQQELSSAVRGFVARYAPVSGTREAFDALAVGERPAHWPALVAQGLHAVHLPEDLPQCFKCKCRCKHHYKATVAHNNKATIASVRVSLPPGARN